MTTPVSIIESADNGNVASVSLYKGGAVPLAAQLKGDAVDCADLALLRLVLEVDHPTNNRGFDNDARLHVTLEHSPTGDAWTLLAQFEPMGGGQQRKVIAAFERYVRASWWIGRSGSEPQLIFDEGVAAVWSLTGVAVEGATE